MPRRESPLQSEMVQGTLDMLILRTLVLGAAHGQTIAQAIDDSSLTEQEGTLAGDNTLLVLFADEARLERWLERFRAIEAQSIASSEATS